jgi:hypothetical protein
MAAPRPKGNTRTGQDKEFTHVDTVTKTRETFAQNEKSYEAKEASAVAPDAGMDLTDMMVRRGHPMTTNELATKLKAINPSFVIRPSQSMPQRCNIFLPQWSKNLAGGWQKELVHVTSCENTSHSENGGEMPEFSCCSTIEETVPGENGERKIKKFDLEVKRGWRTVLWNLLSRGVITRGDLQAHFNIRLSHDSQRWHELTNPPLTQVVSTEVH